MSPVSKVAKVDFGASVEGTECSMWVELIKVESSRELEEASDVWRVEGDCVGDRERSLSFSGIAVLIWSTILWSEDISIVLTVVNHVLLGCCVVSMISALDVVDVCWSVVLPSVVLITDVAKSGLLLLNSGICSVVRSIIPSVVGSVPDIPSSVLNSVLTFTGSVTLTSLGGILEADSDVDDISGILVTNNVVASCMVGENPDVLSSGLMAVPTLVASVSHTSWEGRVEVDPGLAVST